MGQLKRDNHIHNSSPVKCKQYSPKTALLDKKEQFDTVCIAFDCSKPRRNMLNYDLRTHRHRYHQLQDHWRMERMFIISSYCTGYYKTTRRCRVINMHSAGTMKPK
jgi:hypothetical protein